MPNSEFIDLRSDTVTQPTPAMRQAMADAVVGDDVLGDDPTVARLEERVAARFGKPAAVFVPSGTMANQVSIRAHTQHGDEIICHRLSHIYQYEAGAPAVLSGCTFAFLEGERGMFSADDVRGAVRADDEHFPRTSLVVIENTQNRGGGAIWPVADVAAIGATAHELGLKVHLDGARVMNACVAAGVAPDAYGKHVDSVSICFSKGLGAPVGSAVAGDADFIKQARRARKMFGGGMRQSGILAAAALHALDHHVDRLAEDHANAKRLAERIANIPGITVATPETNIVYFNIDARLGKALAFTEKLAANGVWMFDVGPQRIRAVTHLHISSDMIDQAADIIARTAR
ncbi:MAG: DegT/DnrJ/EryC1/StrS family aminotransferase [Phycisphaerales bacterium]|nr:DegT/DnrJ/EryC1/StrS family aminotransferase [Phycisphaerales bacterium]